MEPVFTAVTLPNYNTREYFVQLWDYIEEQYKLHITVHDHIGALQLSDGNMLRIMGNLHRSDYCSYCRKNSSKSCLQHCRWEAMRQAAEAGMPLIGRCYAGVVEVVMPLFRQGVHAATIYGGSFRDANFAIPASWNSVKRNLYNDLPLWHRSYLPTIVRALEMLGSAILSFAENERNTPDAGNSRREIIEDFLRRKLSHRDFSLSDLADKLNLSLSRTSHILQEEFGKSFSELVNELRIDQVCRLLSTTQLKLREIAVLSGFGNQYYLSRVFRRIKNMTPGAYRREYTRDNSF